MLAPHARALTIVSAVVVLVISLLSVALIANGQELNQLAIADPDHTCQNTYGAGDTLPEGFGSPYSFFSNTLLIRMSAPCGPGSATMEVGTGARNQYIWAFGYVWNKQSWQVVQLNGTGNPNDVADGGWHIGNAWYELPFLTNPAYIVAYACEYVNDDWKCGCRDQACTQGYWQLQGVSIYSDNVTGGSTNIAYNTGSSEEVFGDFDGSDSAGGDGSGGFGGEGNQGPSGDDGQNAVTPDGNTYFIDSVGGNNSANGRSEATAWKTLSALAGKSFTAGTNILLKRGGTYIGPIPNLNYQSSANAPLTIATYGTGDMPKVVGSVPVTGWTAQGNGVFRAQIASNVSDVFVNGKMLTLARHPNTGYLRHTAKTGSPLTQIQVGNLPNCPNNCAGAQAVVRDAAWSDQTRNISSYNAGTGRISLSSPLQFNKYEVGWGVYLQNHMSFLDTAGEWFYNAGQNALYVRPPSGVDLNNAEVRGSIVDSGFRVNGAGKHVVIDRVAFEQFGGTAIDVGGGSSDITINRAEIRFSGDGIKGQQGARPRPGNLPPQRTRITNNYVLGMKGDGISLLNWQNALIENNVVEQNQLNGIDATHSEAISIIGNTVRDSGTSGINMGVPYQHMVVENNIVDRYSARVDDQSGIYTWDNGPMIGNPAGAAGGMNRIVGNLVRHGIGSRVAADGKPSKLTTGIYMDDNSENWTINDNIIIDPGVRAINLHNARKMFLTGNIVNTGSMALMANEGKQVYSWAGRNMNNIDLIDNIFLADMENYNRGETGWVCKACTNTYMSPYGPVSTFFRTTRGNIYASRSSNRVMNVTAGFAPANPITLDAYRSQYNGGEAGSRGIQGHFEVIVNDSHTQDRTVNLGSRKLIDGSSPGSVTLGPLEAVVVEK